MKDLLVLFGACAMSIAPAISQAPGPLPRGGAGAGMGVDYLKRIDIVNYVNVTPGALERLRDFKAGAEFFGFVTVPLSASWALKIDYTYMLASYNIEASGGTAQYTVTTHAPSLLVQYILMEGGLYNFKVGAGGGPRFGGFEQKYLYLDDTFTASGPGFIVELEGNTALGEDLFVHLGAGARWEAPGELKDSYGRSPGSTPSGSPMTLNGFGVMFKLGLTYYFF
jgi:hypothetical protein